MENLKKQIEDVLYKYQDAQAVSALEPDEALNELLGQGFDLDGFDRDIVVEIVEEILREATEIANP